MNDPDEIVEEQVKQIEDMVRGLIQAFPGTKYVALNPSISTLNFQTWQSEWYAVGFSEAPYMRELDGFYAWVKSPSISNSGEEDANFFAHFNSVGWRFKDSILQVSRNEFMNEEDLCFYIADSGEVLQYRDADHLLYQSNAELTPEEIVEKMIPSDI